MEKKKPQGDVYEFFEREMGWNGLRDKNKSKKQDVSHVKDDVVSEHENVVDNVSTTEPTEQTEKLKKDKKTSVKKTTTKNKITKNKK